MAVITFARKTGRLYEFGYIEPNDGKPNYVVLGTASTMEEALSKNKMSPGGHERIGINRVGPYTSGLTY